MIYSFKRKSFGAKELKETGFRVWILILNIFMHLLLTNKEEISFKESKMI